MIKFVKIKVVNGINGISIKCKLIIFFLGRESCWNDNFIIDYI